MNLDRALEHAHAMTGTKPGPDGTPPRGAARLYADIEYELAMGDPTPGQERSGERALAVLEEHFPGIKHASDTIVENGHIPRMSRKAKAQVFQHDETTGGGTVTATRPRHAGAPRASEPVVQRPVPRPARQRVQHARRQRAVPRSVTSNATRSVKIVDQATGGWGDDVWLFVLGGFALSFIFLLLTRPKGLSSFATGASNVVRWVIDPAIDPLRPPGSSTLPRSRPAPTINVAGRPTVAGGFRP